MKIFARTQRNFDLTDYVGKDVWILMRTTFGGLYYVKLLHKLQREYYNICRVGKFYVDQQEPGGLWYTKHVVTAQVGTPYSNPVSYDYVVVYPLDILTTTEIMELLSSEEVEE